VTVAEMARAFHERMGLVVRDAPQLEGIVLDERKLRERLVLEEVAELVCAMYGYEGERRLAIALRNTVTNHARLEHPSGVWRGLPDGELVSVARECADLLFMLYGTALHYGFDLDAVAAEVWRAHMEREPDPPGKPRKPEGWRPPDVASVIA
jgi:predicted HAD superfamily Cof-like phosphohydrolase